MHATSRSGNISQRLQEGMAYNNPKPIRMSRRAKVCVASQIKVALSPLSFTSVAIYKTQISNNEPNCYIECHADRNEEE